MSTFERVWFAYLGAVIAVALLADGGGAAGHHPWRFVAVHVGLVLLQVALVAAARGAPLARVRRWRVIATLVGLPIVFSALAWLLPAVHPEPWEYRWYSVDVALFGADVSGAALAALPAPAVLLLQVVYASFYFVPMAAAATVAAVRGPAAFDRTLVLLVGSFLASYLGYLLFPTLAPKNVLPATVPAPPGELAAVLHGWIDAAEANPWDCFPSGHTMLSLTSVLVVFRWARRHTPWFLLVVLPLIASTVVLRYHWPIDVVAGAALAWPVARGLDWLLDRDGAPAA